MKKKTKQIFAKGYSRAELVEHYEALIGSSNGMTRKQLVRALRNTEFEEHAYSHYEEA